MTDEAYDRVIKRGLKLKGVPLPEKRRKSASSNDPITAERNQKQKCDRTEQTDEPIGNVVPVGSEDLDNEADQAEVSGTSAEKSFKMVQLKRQKVRINKQLEMTHRQRMEKFNSHLATLSEHFDIPKVGPG